MQIVRGAKPIPDLANLIHPFKVAGKSFPIRVKVIAEQLIATMLPDQILHWHTSVNIGLKVTALLLIVAKDTFVKCILSFACPAFEVLSDAG
jgi:hypothetical protein